MGVTGVATKPIEGAKEEGVGGFFKGVGKGMVGLGARPTGGIVDSASGIMDAAKRVTEVSVEIHRFRPPRFFHQDGVVRYYNKKDAQGAQNLREVEKGKYSQTDVYIAHENITASDRKSVLLLSNKRVLFIVYNQAFGSWGVDWEYSLPEITGPPAVENDTSAPEVWYLYIKPKEERKRTLGVFGGNTQKKVTMPSRQAAKELANKIEDARIQCATTE